MKTGGEGPRRPCFERNTATRLARSPLACLSYACRHEIFNRRSESERAMPEEKMTQNLRLHYTIMCEDVRLEINHKLSLMGLFYAIQVSQLPVTLLKMAIVNHWSGEGQYLAEVRIL